MKIICFISWKNITIISIITFFIYNFSATSFIFNKWIVFSDNRNGICNCSQQQYESFSTCIYSENEPNATEYSMIFLNPTFSATRMEGKLVVQESQ